MDDRLNRAGQLYERAVYGGETDVLAEADAELDAVEADLALARGRIIHTRFLQQRDVSPSDAAADDLELTLFQHAGRLYHKLADIRGEAEATFWIGCYYQVVRRDNDAAVPVLDRAFELASRAGDKWTMSEALRHLGIHAHAAGRLYAAKDRLEESTKLRREIGLMPGVAANLIGLAYIAAGQDRRDDAMEMLDEATKIAKDTGAGRILRLAEQARTEIRAAQPDG